VLQDLNL